MEAYDGPQIVGMDLHRRRSVLVRMTEDGRKLATVRITNNPGAAGGGDQAGGPAPSDGAGGLQRLVLGGGRAGGGRAEVHLAHPAGVKAFSHRRVKNDLLTELAEAVSLVIGQVVIWWATVARHDHRRRSTAGLGSACGAGAANAF